ncbi:MAG: NusG domain II-containing protein [Ruminococcaceae bacterium]|nr:NusG domain II-containing protein [Oscillospiraceae bacterium]
MKKDRIFIAVYMLICVVISAVVYFYPQGGESREAVIYRSGERVASLPLDKAGEYTFEDIGYTIVSENGRVFIKETHCPGKLCLNMGKISRIGSSIICVPNEITVMIVSNKRNTLDGVAG